MIARASDCAECRTDFQRVKGEDAWYCPNRACGFDRVVTGRELDALMVPYGTDAEARAVGMEVHPQTRTEMLDEMK